MQDPRNILEQAKGNWDTLSGRRKLVIALIAIAVLVGITSLALWSAKPDYAVLFSGVSPEDMQAIEDELRLADVPYKKGANDTSILIPSSEVYRMRMRLANKGLPEVGAVGFEGFDKTDFGTTDFVQKLKYQRALQVELTRTITQLREVSAARVHIVLPRETVFTEREEPAKASVVLSFRHGGKLNPTQINGIAHLVASAVQGLEKDNVTIIDSSGSLLSVPGSSSFLDDKQLAYQKSVETELRSKVQSMLEKFLGPNKATVQVTAEIDFTTTETSSETYDPDKTVVKSEQTTDYSSKGTGAPSGTPGMTTAITPNPPVTGKLSEYKSSDNTVEYEVSKTVERVIHRPGKIKKLSVAVVVDNKTVDGKSVLWTQQELEDIKNLVKNAVGVDHTRGDPQIEVKNIPFDTSIQNEMADAEKAIKREELRSKLIKAGIAIAVVVLVMFVLRLIVKGGRRLSELGMDQSKPRMLEQSTQRPTEEEALPPLEEPIPQLSDSPIERKKQKIINLLDKDPEVVIEVIRNWISK